MNTFLATAGWAEQPGNAVLYSVIVALLVYVVVPLLVVAFVVGILIVQLRKKDDPVAKKAARGFEVKLIDKQRI